MDHIDRETPQTHIHTLIVFYCVFVQFIHLDPIRDAQGRFRLVLNRSGGYRGYQQAIDFARS